jgi:hypothetical protein
VVVTFLTPFSHTIGLIKLSNAARTRIDKKRKDAQCRETEQCHQLRAKAKKILLTVAKDLSSRQDKSFSQKDESQ